MVCLNKIVARGVRTVTSFMSTAIQMTGRNKDQKTVGMAVINHMTERNTCGIIQGGAVTEIGLNRAVIKITSDLHTMMKETTTKDDINIEGGGHEAVVTRKVIVRGGEDVEVEVERVRMKVLKGRSEVHR